MVVSLGEDGEDVGIDGVADTSTASECLYSGVSLFSRCVRGAGVISSGSPSDFLVWCCLAK